MLLLQKLKKKNKGTNSIMQRIDLMSKVGGPAFIGFMMQYINLQVGLVIIALWNVLSFFPEYFLLKNVYLSNVDVLLKSPLFIRIIFLIFLTLFINYRFFILFNQKIK